PRPGRQAGRGPVDVREDADLRQPSRPVLRRDRPQRRTAGKLPPGVHPSGSYRVRDHPGRSTGPKVGAKRNPPSRRSRLVVRSLDQQPAAQEPPVSPAPDPLALVRSRAYIVALVLAGLIGLPVAAVAYGFLALVSWLQRFMFTELPGHLGFTTVPAWWSLPLLALSGLLVALCIRFLPGNCGHSPSEGFQTGGSPLPIELPGVLLAALATLSLGAVLGPEAPLIALGGGLGGLAVRVLKKDAPPTAVALIATAGSFAAISTLLGSPLLGAFLLMEVAGLGGAMLTVALLPGLLAAGIGSLMFVGLDSVTGLGTFSLAIPSLPPFTTPTGAMFLWAIGFGLLSPLLAWGTYALARAIRPAVHAHRVPVTVLLGLVIGALAIAFSQITGKGSDGRDQVLFSGQSALSSLITEAGT